MIRLIFVFLSLIYFSTGVSSNEKFKVLKITSGLSEPWGMSFVDNQTLLVTEKTGDIVRIDYYNIYCVKKNNFDYKDALPSYAGHTI